MTPEEIQAMAKEAGLTDKDLGDWMIDYGNAEAGILNFAALVAEKAAAEEREACADIVENADTPDCGGWTAQGIADAIRARGQKGGV